MAKRRKETEDEEEKVDFKMPKFDEEAFVRKEKEKIKTTFISFIFGCIIALISFGFWTLLSGNPAQWTLVLLFGIFSTAWINYFFRRFNFDIEGLGRKGLFSAYAIYILTWIFVLIVLVNPPFYDDEPPSIEAISLPMMQEPDGTVKIVAHVVDNMAILDNIVDFTLKYNNTIILNDDFQLENNIFLYEFENPDGLIGTFTYTFIAEDTSGYTSIDNGSFSYSADTIRVPEPTESDIPPGPTVRYTTDIKIDVKPDVDWVYYMIDGHMVNVTKTESGFYTSSPRIEGWTRNSEATLSVYAKVFYYFENVETGFNNTIIDTDTYYYNVSGDSEIGTETPPSITLPQPRYVLVPGFEAVVFLLSLLGVALIVKHTRKRSKK